MEKDTKTRRASAESDDPWILENVDKLDDYDGPDLERDTSAIKGPDYLEEMVAEAKAKKRHAR